MSVTANIHEAKTTLSKLIERALAGEEVIIAKAGKPLVHLTPVKPAAEPGRKRGILGAMKGEFQLQPGWDAPDLDKEIEDLIYSKRLHGEYGGLAEE